MSVYIDALKQVNLVEFLSTHYGLVFKRSGSGYVASSPFGTDRNPSFFVRHHEGRWLFKDFSSGLGGSIIDLVGHLEGLSGVGSAIRRIKELIGGTTTHQVTAEKPVEADKRAYEIGQLYRRFQEQDPGVCRQYLVGRGIGEALVDELIADGDVVHNRHQGKSYCCFAVRNAAGELQCLDNHEIEGSGKFVLGSKSIYSRDWEALPLAEAVYVSEGIIDYLSIKTLEEGPLVGIALLGNQLLFDATLLAGCSRIISALDGDTVGSSAFVDLVEVYPDKEVQQYPLSGHKDPNDLLQARGKKNRRLSAKEKLELYRAFQRSSNRSALARQWGIDRSYLYEVVKDIEESVLSVLSSRHPGRPPADQPATVSEAWNQIKGLQERNRQISMERDKSICREEFLRLRLKWSEIEAAELRSEKLDERGGPKRKAQIKKKKKKKRSR